MSPGFDSRASVNVCGTRDLDNYEFHRRVHLEMFQGRVDPMACLENENPSLFGI